MKTPRGLINLTRLCISFNHHSFSIMSREEAKVLGISLLGEGGSQYLKPIRLKYSINGQVHNWDCLKAHDSVAIVLFNTDRNTLVFVRQYRPALVVSSAKSLDPIKGQIELDSNVSGYTLELCAGIIDKEGKSAQEIAKEEVLEETGYDIPTSSLKFVTSARSGCGIQGSLNTMYFANVNDKQKVSSGGGILDENIEVIELSVDEAKQLLWTKDEMQPNARPASMLLGLTWFIYEHYPTMLKK